MNTGMQDAYNLAWKLALVLKNQSPSSLLDSYEAERRPVAQGVLTATDNFTHLLTLKNHTSQYVRNRIIGFLTSIPVSAIACDSREGLNKTSQSDFVISTKGSDYKIGL